MKRTPLHYAALNGNVQAATCLLKAGADVNHRNIVEVICITLQAGETPLMKAAEKGHREMVKLLLYWGGNILLQNNVT